MSYPEMMYEASFNKGGKQYAVGVLKRYRSNLMFTIDTMWKAVDWGNRKIGQSFNKPHSIIVIEIKEIDRILKLK